MINNIKIECIYCKETHKFSPFNVCNIIRYNIKQPLLRKVNDNEYKIFIMDNNDINIYRPLNNNIISNEDIKINDTVYWGGDINMFVNNGLLKLLGKNINYIDNILIENLTKYIYCTKWWDAFFLAIDNYNFIPNEDNYESNLKIFKKVEGYYKIIIDKSINKEYVYSSYNILIKKLGELIKRYNESILDKKRYNNYINKEKENNNKIEKELEYLKKLEEEEINNIEIEEIETFEYNFKISINKVRKSNNIKFLATINPNEQIIADMIIKLGECSKLDSTIHKSDKLKKVNIWELYLKQQEEIKNGKKFKKFKGKKKPLEEMMLERDILLELTSIERIQYKNIYDEYILEKKNNTKKNIDIILDDWQNEAIEYIKNGKSCLIKGPTSGGKTYIMMKGLDNIINMGVQQNVVYVSPTFHLAYQTYANIKVTFPNRKVAIITLELIHIPKDANIFIGTACELLNYFIISNKHFHVGIFDEIHVATILYCDNIDMKEHIRARAYAKLISKCENQIIAASATIRNVDAMRNFIASMINLGNNKKKINYDNIYIVNYEKRIIPLIEYRYINNSELSQIIRENDIEIKPPSKEEIKGIINSENLFSLLVKMRNLEMTPVIIFDNNDDIAWKTYTNIINYCNNNENIDYKDYRDALEVINNIIKVYNIEYNKSNDYLDGKCDISKVNKKYGNINITNNKKEANIRSIISKRNISITKMESEMKLILKRSIIDYNNNKDSICKINNISDNIIYNILELFNCSKNSLYNKYPNFFITQAHVDMFDILSKIKNLDRDIPEELMLFNIKKGNYYTFSNSSSIDLLKAIREPGNNEENWKQRKRMISLAEAQNIKPKDIDNIIDVIINGLEYGMAIINPSLPFIIQNIILENLKNKDIGIVFASESMSMGINYPLRSVIIKSSTGYEKILPGKMIQMSGRCGRRGKDNQAHVIFWGIENAAESNHIYIPPIIYPEHFLIDNIENISGSIITNHELIALKLGEILLTKYFDNNIKTNTETLNIEFDLNEIKLLKKRKSNDILKKEIFLKPVIECITEYLNFEKCKIEELSSMICKIDDDIILDTFFIDSFKKSQSINLLVNMMIELYNFYASCSNIDFLNFIEDIVNILQKCEYKLIKLMK